MKKTITILMLILLLPACNQETSEELSQEQLITISTGAGMLTRSLAYSPNSPGWSAAPDEEFISTLELMSAQNSETWPTFFRAAADTAMKLDQIELQAQQEKIQSEML